MTSNKYKYQQDVDKLPNCPPTTYKEVGIVAFRWVHAQCGEDSFKPVLIMQPTRQLGDEDKTCEGYALSMFLEEEKAYEKYRKLVAKKTHLKEVFGTMIAALQLSKNEGVGSEPELDNYTHFNFHEYEGSDLLKKITNIENIFDENGNFKR
jgi:hypothetical protein